MKKIYILAAICINSAVLYADSIDYRVKIEEPSTAAGVPYNDAVYVSLSGGIPDLNAKAYQDERKRRIDAYVDAVKNPPPPPPEPTKEDLQKEAAELQAKIDELNDRISKK